MVMDRTEPALVPGWLKNSGGTGGGSADHHSASDDHPGSRHAINKSSLSSDSSRTFASERTTSSYFRRSSSSNSSRSYSSFGRSHRDRDREKGVSALLDTDNLGLGDKRRYEYFDPLGNFLTSRFEKEISLRSQVTGKSGDTGSRKLVADLTNANKTSNLNGRVVGNVTKAAFERDFPSLGSEERQSGAEIGRVSSPCLSTPTIIGRDNWTSALIDVPVIMGSNSIATNQQNVSESSATLAPTTTGLNMAEALAQGPSRVRTPPQLSVGTQRLEELAIKQSRQLIPMTPSMPKASVVSPSEKTKAKVGHHQHATLTMSNPRGVPARSEVQKTSTDIRLRVLKPSRELNGVPSTAKESLLSPINGSKVVNGPLGTPLATGSAPGRSSSNSPKFGTADRNPSPFQMIVEKKPLSQTQSRSDFFNLLKKKSSTNSSSSSVSDPSAASAVCDPSAASPSLVSNKADEIVTEDGSVSVTHQAGHGFSSESSCADLSTDSRRISSSGDASDGSGKNISIGEGHSEDFLSCPSEEEAAFMRSLGWEENADGDGGLTLEEISGFLQKNMTLIQSTKLYEGVWSAMLRKLEDGSSSSSSGSNSSDSKPVS